MEKGATENAECNCDQHADSSTVRCPLHDASPLHDAISRGDRNGIINENNIPEGCICYEPGPANQRCPLHEIDQRCPLHEIEPANEIVTADPFNDSLTEILEAFDFNTPQENHLPEPAEYATRKSSTRTS
ncbi:hypothetical protein QE152_g40326 [Popillia japonica]|uniref:Uncharacterized protein n=1 Tax=Popillia japonica TaxID=7064 RepID=A0AAW1HRM1_POPJA